MPFEEDMAIARERLLNILRTMPRTTITANTHNYIHAEVRSRTWGFIDDVEFYLDDQNNLIHGRSASRLGHRDLGVNRRRLEKIRTAFWA